MSSTRIQHTENLRGRQRLLHGLLRSTLRMTLKPAFHPSVPLAVVRSGLTALSAISLPARGVMRQAQTLAGVATEQHALPDAGERVILYLHGGAFCVGSPRSHRGLASHLAQASGATVIVPDYRLAPEHPFPAALDDSVACYRALLDSGIAAHNISIGGDSAGGGLALATAMRLRDEGLPAPARLLLISPWADITNAAASEGAGDVGEVMLSWSMLEKCASQYAGEQRDNPLASPLLGEFRHLPPCLVVVGTREILLPDSERLLEAFDAASGDAHLVVYEGLWHVFPAHAGMLDGADDAIARLAAFSRGDAHYPPEASD